MRSLRVAGALALLVLLVLLPAGPAAAHATLVSSDPAEGEVLETTPDVVTFTFDEPVALTAGSVQVFDAAGDPVESEASSRDTVITADLPDGLDDGSYVVVWRVVSADGHPIAGSLTFAIGEPSAEVAPPKIPEAETGPVKQVLSVAQALTYVGLFLAAGVMLCRLWVLRGLRLDEGTDIRLAQVAWAGYGLLVVAGGFAIPVSGAYQQGLGLGGIGEEAAVSLALVGDDLVVFGLQAVGVLLALTGRRPPVAAAGALVAVVAAAVVGHTRAYEPVPLMVVTDMLHLAAGTAWLGGLVGLALALRALSGRERDAALALSRFSTVAASVLVLLVATGSLMSWRILGAWSAFVDTTYGRLLLVKIGVVAVVALVAGFNRFRLLPRVTGGVGHDAVRRGALGVRAAVRVEALLIIGVLGLTGFLVNQSPRDDPGAARAPVPSRVSVGVVPDAKVLATLAPGRRGPNTVTVQVQDESGEPLDGFAAPTLVVRSADVDLGSVPVVPVAAGTYQAEVVFPAPGAWELQVSLKESEFENPVTTVEVDVS